MSRPWEVDESAAFRRRLGRSAAELGNSKSTQDCPDIWELDNGDVAVTESFADRLPPSIRIGTDERLVVIPGNMMSAAKQDIPDA